MAPQRYKISVDDSKTLVVDEKLAAKSAKDLKLPIRVPLNAVNAGTANLNAQVTLFYCREDNTGTCRIKTLIWKQPVQVTAAATGPSQVKLRGKLTTD